MKRRVIDGLFRACEVSHPVVHRLPLPWCCPIATFAVWLEDRWGIADG